MAELLSFDDPLRVAEETLALSFLAALAEHPPAYSRDPTLLLGVCNDVRPVIRPAIEAVMRHHLSRVTFTAANTDEKVLYELTGRSALENWIYLDEVGGEVDPEKSTISLELPAWYGSPICVELSKEDNFAAIGRLVPIQKIMGAIVLQDDEDVAFVPKELHLRRTLEGAYITVEADDELLPAIDPAELSPAKAAAFQKYEEPGVFYHELLACVKALCEASDISRS